MTNDGYKICGDCGLSKPLSEFYKKLDGTASKCKDCTSITNKVYRAKHRDELNAYRRDYYIANKDELIQYATKYRADSDNKKLISEYKKIYLEENRGAIYEASNKRRKIRRENDPNYRLRTLVSRSVLRMLVANGSSKKGGTIKNHLPFTIDQLKEHLEKQFKPWMNWNNQGKYNTKTWDDNDKATWTWQLDHIIPQSDLPYTSMEDENFKKCWALDNLRPLSAKQNVLDGANKNRRGSINWMNYINSVKPVWENGFNCYTIIDDAFRVLVFTEGQYSFPMGTGISRLEDYDFVSVCIYTKNSRGLYQAINPLKNNDLIRYKWKEYWTLKSPNGLVSPKILCDLIKDINQLNQLKAFL